MAELLPITHFSISVILQKHKNWQTDLIPNLFADNSTCHIPGWLWIWVSVIEIIKIGNIIWGYVFKKQFISLHTIMNKVTGLLLFFLPLTLSFVELKYSSLVVCSIATFSAIQEGVYIVTGCESK